MQASLHLNASCLWCSHSCFCLSPCPGFSYDNLPSPRYSPAISCLQCLISVLSSLSNVMRLITTETNYQSEITSQLQLLNGVMNGWLTFSVAFLMTFFSCVVTVVRRSSSNTQHFDLFSLKGFLCLQPHPHTSLFTSLLLSPAGLLSDYPENKISKFLEGRKQT